MGVAALAKPVAKWCPHCAPGRGCKIYETRPEECRTFNCNWTFDTRLGPQWKPEKSKFILITAPEGNGLEIRCDPGFPTAWRVEPFHSQIRDWSREALEMGGIVVVYVGNSGTLITPDREFVLGEVRETDRIGREMDDAGRVVRAFVDRAPPG